MPEWVAERPRFAREARLEDSDIVAVLVSDWWNGKTIVNRMMGCYSGGVHIIIMCVRDFS